MEQKLPGCPDHRVSQTAGSHTFNFAFKVYSTAPNLAQKVKAEPARSPSTSNPEGHRKDGTKRQHSPAPSWSHRFRGRWGGSNTSSTLPQPGENFSEQQGLLLPQLLLLLSVTCGSQEPWERASTAASAPSRGGYRGAQHSGLPTACIFALLAASCSISWGFPLPRLSHTFYIMEN